MVKLIDYRSGTMVKPEDVEEILFASFMSDYDPSLIFLLTYS